MTKKYGDLPEKCPHCGSTEAILRMHISGDGLVSINMVNRTKDEQGIHDWLGYKEAAFVVCAHCGKRLCRAEKIADFPIDD